MKQYICLLLCSIFLFAACGKKAQKIHVFNWSQYIPTGVLSDFRNETGIEVIYDEYTSNEEMYTKIKAGAVGYDIVFPSGDYVSIMIKENMLHELNKSRLDNMKYLEPVVFRKMPYDTTQKYSIPFALGVIGFAVNKKYVKNFERSYDIFSREDLRNKMSMLDDMREVMSSALVYNGYDQGSDNPQELKKAKETILKWKKNIRRFDAESYGRAFAAGEYWVSHGYAENIFSELSEEQRAEVEYVIPEKGAMYSFDHMVILKNAPNKAGAHEFINYLMRPEIYAAIVHVYNMPNINTGAQKISRRKNLYPISAIEKATMLRDIGKSLSAQGKVWEEIKTGR